MRVSIVISTLLCAVLLMAASAAQAADKIGVLLMHGKQGAPDKAITTLLSQLESAGFPVEAPEMCWSKRRIYDRTYEECLAELDVAATKLRERGATALVVAGHSLGGNGALWYGVNRPVKGVVSLAGAHSPEFLQSRPDIAESLAKAKTMVAEGRGAETANFNEANAGWNFTVSTQARIYRSFFDPEGAAVMPANAARLKVPLLWVAGDRDKTQKSARGVFGKAPANPLNRFVSISADHMDTPDGAGPIVVEWVKALAAQVP